MNHLCFRCDKIATRVCIHKDCSKIPFLCSGCQEDNNISINLHTHNEKINFILYEQLFKRVQKIQNVTYNDHFNDLRKRLNLLLGDIVQMVNKYQLMLRKVELKINQKTRKILDNLSVPDFSTFLTGSCLNELFKDSEKYQNQIICEKLINIAKTKINDIFEKLQNIETRGIFNYEIALQHYEQGRTFDKEGIYDKAMILYQQAHKQYPLSSQFLKSIGYCYDKSRQFDKSLQIYSQCILMGGRDKDISLVYNNIGYIWQLKKNYPLAIQFYTKSIQLKNDNAHCYDNRGFSYQHCNQFQKAIEDHTIAITIKERKKYYKNRALAYKKSGKLQEAKIDQQKMKTLLQ